MWWVPIALYLVAGLIAARLVSIDKRKVGDDFTTGEAGMIVIGWPFAVAFLLLAVVVGFLGWIGGGTWPKRSDDHNKTWAE